MKAFALLPLLAALLPSPILAANVSLSRSTRSVTLEEIASGAPVGGFVHDFFYSADSDLLSVGFVNIDAPLYQHPLGSDTSPASQLLNALTPGGVADSFITTPGSTAIAGHGFGSPDSAWFDTSNDGPRENFHFARLTTMGSPGMFTGRVSVRTYEEYVSLPFEFQLPASEAGLAMLEAEPVYSLDYSLDPPPPPVIPPPVAPPVTPPWQPTTPPGPPAAPPALPGPQLPAPPQNPPPHETGILGSLALTRRTRQVTAAEAAGGAPLGGYVHDFSLTSTTDVLTIRDILIDAALYQSELGSDVAPPNPIAVDLNPAAAADSYITTPGSTGVAGGGFSSPMSAWFDTTNDGGQTDFNFARLTTGASGTFSGVISLLVDNEPVPLPFDFFLPGTEGDLSQVGFEQTMVLTYSHPNVGPITNDPPSVENPPVPPIVYEPPVDPPAVEPPPGPIWPPIVESPGSDPADPEAPVFYPGFDWPNLRGEIVGGPIDIDLSPWIITFPYIDAPGTLVEWLAVDGVVDVTDRLESTNKLVLWNRPLQFDGLMTGMESTSTDQLTLVAFRNMFQGTSAAAYFGGSAQDFDAGVPEPTSFALGGAACLLGTAGRRRRQR